MGVTTSTEGGCFDAANGYDRAVLSLGLIQIIPEAGLGTLLRSIFEQVDSTELQMVRAWEARYGVDLLHEIETNPNPNRALRLYGCTGRAGSWTGSSWDRAEQLLQALLPVLALPQAQEIQLNFVSARILNWVMPVTRKALFQELHGEGWLGALQAAVVSFSANNPTIADRHFRRWVEKNGPPVGTAAYVMGAIDQMTFGPQIAIYPERKRAISREIQRLYGVRLTETVGPGPVMSTKAIQEILLRLGYDLGPAKADGIFGGKTRLALVEYQRAKGLDADGIPGPKTYAALAKE